MTDATTRTDDRAVSPVVGVTLLIGIAVILAAVIGGVVLGIGLGPADAPQATLEAENFDTSADEFDIVHNGGDPVDLSNVELRGDVSATLSGQLAAGESKTITSTTIASGDEITVVWVGEDGGDDTVLATFEVP